MDTLEFIRERNRMCRSFGVCCNNCPADKNASCDGFAWKEELVTIVEKWSKENPRKTRQSVFLEQWPEVILDKRGISVLCPKQLNREFSCLDENDTETPKRCKDCSACRHEFWMQEV